MTCYCNSLKLKECSCKLFGYPVKGNPAPFFVENLSQIGQVERTDCFRQSLENGKLYRILELLYDKCAAYNLRYCPLKKAVDQDKYIINAVKDLAILTCFLVANLIVFVIILARTVLHIFAVFKVTGHGIRKYLTTVSSESSTSFNFANTGWVRTSGMDWVQMNNAYGANWSGCMFILDCICDRLEQIRYGY